VAVSLEPRGKGDYRTTLTQTGTCGGQTYDSTPANMSQPNILAVARPTITGPGGTSGPYGIWWLGGGTDDDNGYFNRATLTANPNGSPGSPTWSLIQGQVGSNAGRVALSCTTCNFPLVTSEQRSSNCAYDVGVRLNYNGFSSNVYLLNVNAPYYMESSGLASTNNFLSDGWITVIPYLNRDRCLYPMPSIALNEVFGTFTQSNWPKPVAQGTANYNNGYIWYDQIFIAECPNCAPPVQRDNPPGQAVVDQAQQFWNLGSSTPGLGIYVQQNTFRRHTGHGEHLNLIRVQ
jgi:hypothetical protein